MGVGYQGLQIALLAKRQGVDFARTISIARQHHYLDPGTLQSMFQRDLIEGLHAEGQEA